MLMAANATTASAMSGMRWRRKAAGILASARRGAASRPLPGFGEVLAAELQEAAHARLLALDPLGQAAGVPGGALGEVLKAALRVIGERVDVRDVLLRTGDAQRRAALGEGS